MSNTNEAPSLEGLAEWLRGRQIAFGPKMLRWASAVDSLTAAPAPTDAQIEPYNKETANTEDRIAWALCQIIDDDAPLRWPRYRSAAHCIARNPEVMTDLRSLEIRREIDAEERLRATPSPEGSALPDVCDGKEQDAFEQFLRDRKMSTITHPIHWLFLDAKSYAAREAWKAAISYCRKEVEGSAVGKGAGCCNCTDRCTGECCPTGSAGNGVDSPSKEQTK
jgi:hypothetical protein